MKKILTTLLLLSLILIICAGCVGNDSKLSEIRDRGVLRAGVKLDVPGFGFYNDDTREFEGLEVDIARLIAQKILGDENAVEFFGVTTQTKGPMLTNGELDLVIATFTITDERKELYNFSQSYYTEMIGFMVRADSDLQSMADMAGKSIGIMQMTTSENALITEAARLGIEVDLVRHASYPEMKAALLSGKIDSFSADTSILVGYNDNDTRILDESFNPQNYGIATKLENEKFAKYIDDFLSTIIMDGRYAEIIDRWS